MNQNRQELCFQVKDGFDLFFAQDRLKVLPKLQCKGSVLLGVLAHEHRGKLPKFFFGVDVKVASRFF